MHRSLQKYLLSPAMCAQRCNDGAFLTLLRCINNTKIQLEHVDSEQPTIPAQWNSVHNTQEDTDNKERVNAIDRESEVPMKRTVQRLQLCSFQHLMDRLIKGEAS